ncbi:MAG TPA: glycosyltransferase [Armatimonadota bacterium]
MAANAPLVVHVAEAAAGGVARHLLDLLTGLAPERFRQEAILSERRVNPALLAGPWRVQQLDMRREVDPVADWAAFHRLRRLLAASRPALVHAHSSKAGFLARCAAASLRIPAIYTPHVFPFQMPVAPARRRLYVRLERWAARRCCRIACVSEGERQAALREAICPPEQLVLIRNGVALPPPVPPQQAAAARERLGVAAEDELLLAVGELRPQKDYPRLLRAVATLAPRRPRLRLVIAGEGDERPRLEALAAELGLTDRVRLPGEHEAMEPLRAAADVLVITSRYEGCPYSLLEAMAAGLPVVAVAAPGVDEIVREGETGRLVPEEDLPAAIADALDHPEPAAQRAERAREQIVARFGLERMLAETAALYDSCLGRSAR